MRRAAIGAAVATAGLLLVTVTPPVDAAPTPHCASKTEYRLLDVFMKPKTVVAIFDINGWRIDTPDPDTFARGYKPCWKPRKKKIVVWYDQQSHLSIRWAVKDR